MTGQVEKMFSQYVRFFLDYDLHVWSPRLVTKKVNHILWLTPKAKILTVTRPTQQFGI